MINLPFGDHLHHTCIRYQTYWGWFSISLTQLVAMKFPRLCHACCVSGSAATAHDSHPEELGTVIMAGKFSNMEVYSYGHLLFIAGLKGLCLHFIFIGL